MTKKTNASHSTESAPARQLADELDRLAAIIDREELDEGLADELEDLDDAPELEGVEAIGPTSPRDNLARELGQLFALGAPALASLLASWVLRPPPPPKIPAMYLQSPPRRPLASRAALSLAEGVYRTGRAVRSFVLELHRPDHERHMETLATARMVRDAVEAAFYIERLRNEPPAPVAAASS